MNSNTNETLGLISDNMQTNELLEIRQINIYIENDEPFAYNMEHIEKKLQKLFGGPYYSECSDGFVDWRYPLSFPMYIRESYLEQLKADYENVIRDATEHVKYTSIEIEALTMLNV